MGVGTPVRETYSFIDSFTLRSCEKTVNNVGYSEMSGAHNEKERLTLNRPRTNLLPSTIQMVLEFYHMVALVIQQCGKF